ncbi:hypothetical protein [Nostoc sp. CCY0012]
MNVTFVWKSGITIRQTQAAIAQTRQHVTVYLKIICEMHKR